MDYQVWIKVEYSDDYKKVDCGDIAAAKREIDHAVRAGQEPILTQELPFKLSIEVGEVGAEKPKGKKETKLVPIINEEVPEVETAKGKAEPDQGPGAKSNG